LENVIAETFSQDDLEAGRLIDSHDFQEGVQGNNRVIPFFGRLTFMPAHLHIWL
jgi:hypothetical protein